MSKRMDRYTRLKAITEFGYGIDWDTLSEAHVLIAGVGGLGSIAAEMLTRCGVGQLTLVDSDIVEEVNLNRLFYRSEHIGRSKVDVAEEVLRIINPDTQCITHHTDIMADDFDETFEGLLKKVDLLLMGLDNLPSRHFVNIKCVKFDLTYIDAGLSRSGLGGYIRPIIPRQTACYACPGAFDLQKKREWGESCTASLPTTTVIIAGLQVQQALVYLLNIGELVNFVSYNALTTQFTYSTFPRNSECPICGDETRTEIIHSKTTEEDIMKLIDQITFEFD
ncbi:MAG: ThiF family adenylyltransferase [Promethearchaeota archaeon]